MILLISALNDKMYFQTQVILNKSQTQNDDDEVKIFVIK